MPKVTVRVPLPKTLRPIPRRGRKRAGMGALFTTQPVVLPGANVFVRPRGVGSLPRRGVGDFLIKPSTPPVFPGKNIFPRFAMERNCARCPHPCGARRGMGQDDGTIEPIDITPSVSEQSSLDVLAQIPVATVPAANAPATPSAAYDASYYAQQAGVNLTPQQTAALNASNLSPTQLQAAVNTLQATQSTGAPFNLSTWLSQQTILQGYTNATVVLGGGALAILGAALLSGSGKKKRR